jgi:DNA-binding SARP family transcriptional activator/tetratricopeptide (TPR) repeat protein
VVTSVGQAVENLQIRLLGPLTVARSGAPTALPRSRKLRALLAYLALAPRPCSRSALCELLWEVPNDPRGELRWCLSKLRALLDEPGRQRVVTAGQTVSLNLGDCIVDATEVAQAAGDAGSVAPDRLCALVASSAGEFLEGLELVSAPVFSSWLIAQRRRFRDLRATLLERLAACVPDDEVLGTIEAWLEMAPFDRRAHQALLGVLARQGRVHDREEHARATQQRFESEGLDGSWLRESVQPAAERARHASVAIMPFGGEIGEAITHDVITRLAKLRSLFVIAEGTVFTLQRRATSPEEAGRLLDVDYIVSGSVRRDRGQLAVSVELSQTRTSRIVWADDFRREIGATFEVLDELNDSIVASIASEIETSERNRAILIPPRSLDAWEAYHRGLWHMYCFTKVDNESAREFFELAATRDPTFARAYSALSFTHFQQAFLGWGDRATEIERAYGHAGRSLLLDDRDPSAHWAMGRALWLRGKHDASVAELEQAVELSPNFALGHYTLAFVLGQAGDANVAISAVDRSRRLSPFDPLLFGMFAVRATALARLGRFDEAARTAMQIAGRPNAHVHALAIAALCLTLADQLDEARTLLTSIRERVPDYGLDDFMRAFRFDQAGEAMFRTSARRLGLAR